MITKGIKKKTTTTNNIPNSILLIAYTFIVPILIVLVRPLEMSIRQSLLLACLLLTITWWTTNVIKKNYASLFLLGTFLIEGSSTLRTIFRFPLSSNFFVIACSFLLSQGIVNSNVANRISKKILNRYGRTPYQLIALSFILSFIINFLIPQPFSRVILIAGIYTQFLSQMNISSRTKEILLYSIFVASTSTSMLFINGDIVLNNSALEFGRISIGWIEWAVNMGLPSLLTTLIMGISFCIVFRRDLKESLFIEPEGGWEGTKPSDKEKIATLIMVVVVLLWATETYHHINSAVVAIIGTLAMFVCGILGWKDVKRVNIDLLLFLTVAYAIGSVLNESGIAHIIYGNLVNIFPKEYSPLYMLIIILTVMGLHMVLGSSITTLSVAVPGLIELTKGKMEAVPLVLLAYIIVNIHYLLPFHHVTIMIGAGEYYTTKTVFRYGLVQTMIVLMVAFMIYIPWWRLIGIL
ncbi:SLC13 family permease [Geosporobacter ferrireducens]|nr:SLC13 family permease [Geosporobacter ferrireducens]